MAPMLWNGLAGAMLFASSLMPALAQSPVDRSARPGPALRVLTLGGGVVEVQRLKGKVVLLDFMTTVCPACRAASAGVQKLYQELGPKGFHPIGVALNAELPSQLKDYRQVHGLSFPLGVASRMDVVRYLEHPPDRPFLVPALVLLDKKGTIRLVQVGWKGEEPLRAEIAKLLKQ